MRINARLDESSSQMLAYLRDKTRGRTTDVIKRALALYYQQIKTETAQGPQRLLDSPFIGCGDADPGLSSHYKSLLTESLGHKHPGAAVHDNHK